MSMRNEIRRTSSGGFIGSIVVNSILLYVAHHLIGWQLAWITPSWSDVLWAVDLTLGVSIIANVLFVAFDVDWFRNLAGAVSCAVAVLATWWIYVVFPFDFGSASANGLAHLILVVLLLATSVAAVVTATLGVFELLHQGLRTPGAAEH